MKIDIIFEMQTPRPWDELSDYRRWWEAVEETEFADQMGFDTVWCVEHHFLEEFSHSSAPEIFLSAVAQRTKNIRIGHGVVLLPSPFNHPIRVAERVAALDILSNGRVEFGTGRSSEFEQTPFGINYSESRELFQEALDIIPLMWHEGQFEHHGKFFDIPARSVFPKPLQKPHPPIWMAGTSPESWEIAGRNGAGMLGLTVFNPLSELVERNKRYKEAIKTANPVGRQVNNQTSAFTVVHCADDDDMAAEQGAESALWYAKYAVRDLIRLPDLPPTHRSDGTQLPPEMLERVRENFRVLKLAEEGRLTFEELMREDYVIVGSPQTCLDQLQRYHDAGIDHVLCFMQAAFITHEQVMRSIELFGKHIIPHFKKLDQEKEQAASPA